MNRLQDATSKALLEAAQNLLATQGPEALTVRRIANEAGMSTMNVYSRFGGKDGVIDELFVDGYRRLIAQIEAVPITDDIQRDLLAVADTYRDFALTNPTYYGVMLRSTIPGYTPAPDAVQLALGGLTAFIERVRAGQERGEVIADRPADEIAAWLWATCHGLVSLELDGVATSYLDWASIWSHGVRTTIAALKPSVSSVTN